MDVHNDRLGLGTAITFHGVKGMAEVVPLIEVDSLLVLVYPGFSWGKCKIFCWGRYNQDRPCVVKNHTLLEVTLLILNTADLDLAGRKRAPTCRRTKHEEPVRKLSWLNSDGYIDAAKMYPGKIRKTTYRISEHSRDVQRRITGA